VEAALPLLLKQLKLARFRSHWQPLAQQAETEGWSPCQFLHALCEQECDHLLVARRQRLLRDAHLPWQKGVDGFDQQQIEAKHCLQSWKKDRQWPTSCKN
jgi:DNA replication protein DnaC